MRSLSKFIFGAKAWMDANAFLENDGISSCEIE